VQSASSARTTSNSTTSTLSYIDGLVTTASSNGIYTIAVDSPKMTDSMMSDLTTLYGYTVYKKTYDFGNYVTYIIDWSK
jgi:hypothetical protein